MVLPLQQWLHDCSSILRYVNCLSFSQHSVIPTCKNDDRGNKCVSSLSHYLLCLVTRTSEFDTKIKARIIACNKFYLSLGHVLKKRYTCITHSVLLGLYKTIRQIATYGAKLLTLRNEMGSALMTWE
jgi:hypothetical protein